MNQKEEKTSFIIYILIGILLLSTIMVAFLSKQPQFQTGSFITLDKYSDNLLHDIYNDYVIIRSKKEFSKYKFSLSADELNFDKYDYILFVIDESDIDEKDFKPVDYSIKNEEVRITVKYTYGCAEYDDYENWDYRTRTYGYYLLPINKKVPFNNVYISYDANAADSCDYDDDTVVKKPIIYLYPEKEMDVSVQLGRPELLSFSYPDYQKGWKVIAKPNGTLLMNDREYYGLFWEGDKHPSFVHEDGFVVKGEDTIPFFEKQLKILGLTDKEANEFIIYWSPILEKNTYNYIYFETEEEINSYMPLTVQPTPDHIIRVQMDYKPLTEKIEVKEQVLSTPVREGFTVVEWGGSIIKD